MLNDFMNNANYPAILVAAFSIWLVGFLWYTVLFRKAWMAEMERLGIKIQDPSKSEMIMKLILNYGLNLVVAIGLAVLLIPVLGITDPVVSMKWAAFIALCFAGTTVVSGSLWEGRSIKSLIIDVAYYVIGAEVAAVILTAWQ
jgi:hypothetical protein